MDSRFARTLLPLLAVFALALSAPLAASALFGSSRSDRSAAAAKKKRKKKRTGVKRGPNGPGGPGGPRGPIGPVGPRGPIGPSNVFEAHNNGPTTATADGTTQTLVTLSNLPAGNYAISGKANITRLAGGNPGVGGCTLTAGTDADGANEVLQNALTLGSTVPTQLVHNFTSTGTVTLSCTANGGTSNWLASQAKVVAIKVGSLTSNAVTG